jgi:ribosomal protein S18 acetylase RimI-like enzyme
LNPIKTQSDPDVYTIRLATIDDATVLAEIGIKTFRDTFADDNTEANMSAYLNKTFVPDQITQEISDPHSTFILAYHGTQIVGYAKLRKYEKSSEGRGNMEIERLYASKDYIGKKVGKTLMLACLNRALASGYKTVWLGVWERNRKAIAFYESWGFKITGSHPFLLGDDVQTDLIMEKKLDTNETASI